MRLFVCFGLFVILPASSLGGREEVGQAGAQVSPGGGESVSVCAKSPAGEGCAVGGGGPRAENSPTPQVSLQEGLKSPVGVFIFFSMV